MHLPTKMVPLVLTHGHVTLLPKAESRDPEESFTPDERARKYHLRSNRWFG